MVSELKERLERYQARAAHCEQAAHAAENGAERAFYAGLALYYHELANDFRRVIARRTGISVAAE